MLNDVGKVVVCVVVVWGGGRSVCDGAIEGSVCMCVCVHVYVDMYMCMCAYIILTLHTQQWEDLLDGEDDSLISDDQPSTEADPDCNVGVVEVPLSLCVQC